MSVKSHNASAHAAMRALTHPNPELNMTDRAIYAYLVYRANGARLCWKKVEEIIAELPGCKTRQTVGNATRKLRNLKLIEVVRRRRDSNHYKIIDADGYLYGVPDANQDGKETVQQTAGLDVEESTHQDAVLDVEGTAHLEAVDVKNTGLLEAQPGWQKNRLSDGKNTDLLGVFDGKETIQESLLQGKCTKEGTKEKVVETRAHARGVAAENQQAIVDAWNAMARRTGLQTVRCLTPDRRRKLAQRIYEHGQHGVLEAIERIGDSPWCHGDNPNNWRAGFDFVLQASSCVKALEGAYDRRDKSTTSQPKSVLDQIREDWGADTFLKPKFDDEPAGVPMEAIR